MKYFERVFDGILNFLDKYFKVIFVCILGIILFVVIPIAVYDMVCEINEPDSGEIYELKYHPAYTTQQPIYSTHYNSSTNTATQTIVGYNTIHHPEKWEVKYRDWNDEKKDWDLGDNFVDQHTYHQLKVGDFYSKLNN